MNYEPSLKKGERILYGGVPHRVLSVNQCAAKIVRATKKEVTIKGRAVKMWDKKPIYISPDSIVTHL